MANTDIAYEEQEPSRDMMYLLYMKDSLFAVVIFFKVNFFYVLESSIAFSFLTLEIY